MNFGKKIWLIGNTSEKSKKTMEKLSKILKAEHFLFDDINPAMGHFCVPCICMNISLIV